MYEKGGKRTRTQASSAAHASFQFLRLLWLRGYLPFLFLGPSIDISHPIAQLGLGFLREAWVLSAFPIHPPLLSTLDNDAQALFSFLSACCQ